MTIETKITNLRRTIELANQYWDDLNLKAFECEDEVETDLIMEEMRSVQAYGKRCEQDLWKLLEQKHAAKKKVNAHLFNRYGNSHHGFYSYYHVGNNLEEMKANAIATTYGTGDVVDIVDRETGEILAVVRQGFVTYEA